MNILPHSVNHSVTHSHHQFINQSINHIPGLNLDGGLGCAPIHHVLPDDLVVTLFKVKAKQHGHWLLPCPDFPILLNDIDVRDAMLLSPG